MFFTRSLNPDRCRVKGWPDPDPTGSLVLNTHTSILRYYLSVFLYRRENIALGNSVRERSQFYIFYRSIQVQIQIKPNYVLKPQSNHIYIAWMEYFLIIPKHVYSTPVFEAYEIGSSIYTLTLKENILLSLFGKIKL